MLLPGDVVWADFPGAKETKQRPCVVVSSELYQGTRPDVLLAVIRANWWRGKRIKTARPDVLLAVITSNIAIATAPTDFVLFDWREAGLDETSAVRIYISPRWQHQVTRIGHLSEADWNEVQARLRLALEV